MVLIMGIGLGDRALNRFKFIFLRSPRLAPFVANASIASSRSLEVLGLARPMNCRIAKTLFLEKILDAIGVIEGIRRVCPLSREGVLTLMLEAY